MAKYIRFQLKRAKNEIKRHWPNIEKMESVAVDMKKNRGLTHWEMVHLNRHLTVLTKKAEIFEATRTDLLGQCSSDEEREFLLGQIMLVPAKEFARLRKLEATNRTKALREILDEYKPGNGGHDKNHFDRSDFFSPYDAGEKTDYLGLKRRPHIIYEVIDRLLYAVLHPEDNKALFFRRTHYKVQKWDSWMRQIRSEGRESMIKVLITLLQNWNPRRMISGIEQAGKWIGLSVNEIARRSGLSFSRTKEALRNLERTDILWSGKQKRIFDRVTQKWRGYTVVRAFKPTLFQALKVDEKVWKARKYVSEVKTAPRDIKIDQQAKNATSASDVLALITAMA